MKAADAKQFERMLATCDKLIQQIDDARRRGSLGDWQASSLRPLRSDLVEFLDWQSRKLADLKSGARP